MRLGIHALLCTKVCLIRKLFVQSLLSKEEKLKTEEIIILPRIPTCSDHIRLSTVTYVLCLELISESIEILVVDADFSFFAI